MKLKIEEKTKKLQQIIEAINQSKQRLIQLEQEGLMIQGEIRLLKELETEKAKKELETEFKKESKK